MRWLIGGHVPETGIAAKANCWAIDYWGLAWVSSPRDECLVIVQKGLVRSFILWMQSKLYNYGEYNYELPTSLVSILCIIITTTTTTTY